MIRKILAALTAITLSLGVAALTASPASATPAADARAAVNDPTPYVLVAWAMPSWIDSTTPSWSQTFFAKIDLATLDLSALDGQLTACGTQFQVDLYNDSATTTSLIAGNVLNGPHNPPEDFPSPSGWGLTYKLIHNVDCQTTPDPATFDPAQCVAGVPGQANYTIPVTTGIAYSVQINGVGGFNVTPAGTYYVAVGTKVEVKAAALPGHVAIGVTEWSTTFATPSCIVNATATPATGVAQQCVVARNGTGSYVSGYLDIPNSTGVDYFIAPSVVAAPPGQVAKAPGTYTVTASAKPGFVLVGYTGPWHPEILAAAPCGDLIVLPLVDPTVTFAQTTCRAAGTYTLAVAPVAEAAGVIWTVSGGLPNTLGSHSVSTAGTVTVTATPAAGYGFPGANPLLVWSYDFTTLPADCLPTLALTGADVTGGWLGAIGLLALGGILVVAARGRELTVTED